ncbi:MAG: tetratricopeptide repeat protein [bacterium]
MFLSSGRVIVSKTCLRSMPAVFAALVLGLSFAAGHAQGTGGVDFTGTGGLHSINGRIYFPSGRGADVGVKVQLESTNAGGGRTVFADSNGSFSFRNLEPGSYTVVVEGGKEYETVRETVLIDDPRQRTTGVVSMPRNFMVPIYLRPKPNAGVRAQAGVLNAALANVPPPARELYKKALETAQAGDTRKAIDELRTAVSLYPEFPLALNELGVQYLKMGQPEKAAEALRTAVKLTPDAFTPCLNYGIALLEKKDFAGAEAQLRQALKKNDAAPTAHLYLGITLINERSYDEAEKEFLRTLSSGGDSMSQVHYYLGGLYWRKNQHKQAADELEKYLRLAPKAPDAERIRATIKDLQSKSLAEPKAASRTNSNP